MATMPLPPSSVDEELHTTDAICERSSRDKSALEEDSTSQQLSTTTTFVTTANDITQHRSVFTATYSNSVDGYIFNEEEKYYKKIIWESANCEYLEEQAAKEAAVAAQKKIYEENMKNCPIESRELYESTTAVVAKSRKAWNDIGCYEKGRLGQSFIRVRVFLLDIPRNENLVKRLGFEA